MGTKSQRLFFVVAVNKIWITTWSYSVLLLLGGTIVNLIQDPSKVLYEWLICKYTAIIFLLKAFIAIKFPVLTWYDLIILQTINEEVFVYITNILNVQILQECINFERNIGDKVCNFISLYRSPSQTLRDFVTFSKNFELNFENIVQEKPFSDRCNWRF